MFNKNAWKLEILNVFLKKFKKRKLFSNHFLYCININFEFNLKAIHYIILKYIIIKLIDNYNQYFFLLYFVLFE